MDYYNCLYQVISMSNPTKRMKYSDFMKLSPEERSVQS